MTVTKTNIAAILARLEKVEARQNLLKDNLLSLKKKVDTLADSFQHRPELAQIQSIQTTLNELAQFGTHIDNSLSAKNNLGLQRSEKPIIPKDGIDPDVLVMPLLDSESELEEVFDNDLGADLSTLLDTMDIDGGQSLDDLDLDEPLDDDLGDRLLDPNLDIDNLDLENISLDELEQLDIYDLGNLDDDLGDSSGLAETMSQNFEAADLDNLEDFGNGAGLGNGQIGRLNDTVVKLTETNVLDSEQGSSGLNVGDLELDPMAMNALDLADLSDIDLNDLATANLEELPLNDDLSDLELPDEFLAAEDADLGLLENIENPEGSGDDNGLTNFDNANLDDLAIASSVGQLDLNIDNLELEVAAEMENYDNLLSPDYDEIFDAETESSEPPLSSIANRLIEPAAIAPAAEIQQELELAANDDLEIESEEAIAPEEPTATNPVLDENGIVQETTQSEATINEEIVEELPTPEAETTAIAAQELPDELTEIPPEITAETTVSPTRTPVIDTESPEELATAPEPPAPEPLTDAAAPQAELTAAEIMTRIDNRQHYFIGFQLMRLQLAQQNLRDCVFDTSNLQNSQLQNSDLRDSSFKGCNLTAANLEYTSLERAIFEQANLAKAKLQGILFNSRTSFLGANLEGADFSYLDLTRPPELKQANLRQTKFIGVNLRGVNCKDWNFTEANLQRANLIDTNFRDADLTNADLTGAIYSTKTIFPKDFQPQGALLVAAGEDLSQQDLHKHDLSQLDLTKVNFSGANLEHANLDKCDLSDANLSGANLRRSQLRATCLEANFEEANLTQADLSEANVTGSNFTNANFQAATLKNANFTMADLRGAQLKNANTYRMNCNGANLENMDLTGIDFEGDLSGANLTRAKLCDLNFNYLDLSWANLTDADVTGVTFKETNLDNANLRGATGFDLESYDYKIYLNNTILPDGNTLD